MREHLQKTASARHKNANKEVHHRHPAQARSSGRMRSRFDKKRRLIRLQNHERCQTLPGAVGIDTVHDSQAARSGTHADSQNHDIQRKTAKILSHNRKRNCPAERL